MDTIERKLDVAAREAAFVMRVPDDPKSPFNAMEPIRDVYFRKGAEWMREELTQWHDPNKPPAKGHTVLLKIKNSEDNVKYAVGYNACGCWYGGGVGRYDHVVGWREIHE